MLELYISMRRSMSNNISVMSGGAYVVTGWLSVTRQPGGAACMGCKNQAVLHL